jgi:hypothetical protein
VDVGYYAPACSSIASDQETKALSNKRTTLGCSCSSTGGSVIKPLRHLARQIGGLGISLEAMLLLLKVIIPAMMLQFYLLCGFTPTGDFVLRQLLNHDITNKLSQLSVFVSFTLRVTCLGSVLIYVTQGFHTVNQ